MAKAILEYDLNDPDDTMAHLRAVKSLDMALILWEMAYNAKKGIHYDIEGQNITDPYEAVNKVFEKLWEEIQERGVFLDELVN